MKTISHKNVFYVSLFLLVGVVLCAMPAKVQAQFKFTTIDDPSAGTGFPLGTQLTGISGTNIVGNVIGSSPQEGFLYNGSSFTQLQIGFGSAFAYGIDGNNIVGRTAFGQFLGYVYNAGNITTINDPLGLNETYAYGISGTNVVGYYYDSSHYYSQGFLYNGSTYTTLTNINGGNNSPQGISGNVIVGNSLVYPSGFIYVIGATNYTTVSFPSGISTSAQGISGKYVVGAYSDTNYLSHGFLYDMVEGTYTTLDDPTASTNLGSGYAQGTVAMGIDGTNIVGYYFDASGTSHGFKASMIPQPPSLGISAYASQPAVFFPTATGTNFVLQMTTNLATGQWVTVTNGIPINGLIVTNPPNNAFFRLH